MNKKRLFHFGQVVIISLALLFAPTISYNVDAATQQGSVMYSFGVHKIDKAELIRNLRGNVYSYLDYKRRNGWSSYYIEEFQNAYTRFMAAFDDPRDPYRFSSNDFGVLNDSKGEFSNRDWDDYWYNKKGQRRSGYEYNSLKESKKKDYYQFNANRHFAAYFNLIIKEILKE